MDATDLQQVRSMPLFSGLDDTQLGCIEPGEVINVPASTVLVSEGDLENAIAVLEKAGHAIQRVSG